jgi:hypothetical protein
MRRSIIAAAFTVQVLLLLTAVAAPARVGPRDNMIFIHHSIGRGLLVSSTGATRDSLAAWNARAGTEVVLWDHDYGAGHPVWGLSNTDGVNLGYSYGDEFNNTIEVDGYRQLFCTANAGRDSLMANHAVIAFKPGYESGWLWLLSDAQLDSAKADYLAMRGFFDLHPEKAFVVVTQPPVNRNADYLDPLVNDRSRALSNWLKSAAFLSGHPNVYAFDLFDQLATPDLAGDPLRNTLRYEYEADHATSDPHPNDLANTIVGPLFAHFLYTVAVTHGTGVPGLNTAVTLAAWPNPFNPRVEFAFDLAEPAIVRLAIHDARGRLVAELDNGALSAGRHLQTWDGRDSAGRAAASGAYFARLQAAGRATVIKVMLAR